ncbi:MAG: hypothetical protein CML00_08645 [Pseudomonas sp.]|nr:hypothetical protein [Pseudomonas sp.]|tara:strand:- start:2512 stop:4116 length:1605 start_codon:yes stop_codon:yes gene_type:complete
MTVQEQCHAVALAGSFGPELEKLKTEREEKTRLLDALGRKLNAGADPSPEEYAAAHNAKLALAAIDLQIESIEQQPRIRADRAISSIFRADQERFVELPAALQKTVIGKLAKRAAHCLEFPEASTFLALLGSASASVATAYAVQYVTGTSLPTGLFAIVEQPPATQKSYLLSLGMSPYERGVIDHNKRVAAFNKEAEGAASVPYAFLNATDATSAALDEALSSSDSGRFVIASAEQSAFASLFPEAGTYSSNNELLLKGYPGEYVSSLRKGRRAFHGVASGSVMLVAQPGSAKRVFSASNGSGLAERFLYMAEPSLLGKRTLHGEYLTKDDMADFSKACAEAVRIYSSRVLDERSEDGERVVLEPEALHQLRAASEGYALIRNERKRMEPRLGELERRGDMVMLSWLGKLETHALKVAAVLHVIECGAAGCKVPDVIPTDTIRAAVDFILTMGAHLEDILRANGESGDAAEVEAAFSLISGRRMSLTDAVLLLKNRAPFKAMGGGAYKGAKRRLVSMMNDGLLMTDASGNLITV